MADSVGIQRGVENWRQDNMLRLAPSSVARVAAPLLRRAAVPALASRRGLSSTSDAIATPAAKKGDGAISTEVKDFVDAETMEAFTGAPADMLASRVVKIYQQAQTVQNATQNMLSWRVQWEDGQTERWTNPLMGWTSTSDPLSNAHMTLEFSTADDAVRYCLQNGWKDEIAPTAPNKEILAEPKSYSANFKWKGPKGRKFPDLYKPPPPPPPPPKS